MSSPKKFNEMNRNTFSLSFSKNKYAFITIIIAQQEKIQKRQQEKSIFFMIFIQIYFFTCNIQYILLYFVGSGHSLFMGQA